MRRLPFCGLRPKQLPLPPEPLVQDPLPRLETILRQMEQGAIDEIVFNGPMVAHALRGNVWHAVPSPWPERSAMLDFVHALAEVSGARLDAKWPAAGGPLPKGQGRWHVVLPPAAPEGPCLSIRRHRFGELSLQKLAKAEDVAMMAQAFAAGRPLAIAGPTGSGKTSLMAALLCKVALHLRLAVLESLAELPLASPLWIRLVERPPDLAGRGALPLACLIPEVLRLRPDRIVVGELRADEVMALVQASSSGHGGVVTTVHASVRQDLERRFPELLTLEPVLVWVKDRRVAGLEG